MADVSQFHIMLIGREQAAKDLPFPCNFTQTFLHRLLTSVLEG